MALSLGIMYLLIISIISYTQAHTFLCPTGIFTFGDSFTDGGNSKLESGNTSVASSLPYGVTYGSPTGRYSDGLLIVDYLLRGLSLEDLARPSLSYNGSFFKSLNFAYAGGVLSNKSDPVDFWNQLNELTRHRLKVANACPMFNQMWYNHALHYIQFGAEDIVSGIETLGFDGVREVLIPRMLENFLDDYYALNGFGAGQYFLLLGVPALGCIPGYIQAFSGHNVTYDELGCIVEVNDVAEYFNARISEFVHQLTVNHTDTNTYFYYFDYYAAHIEVLNNMDKYWFQNRLEACCGSGGDYNCAAGSKNLCGCGDVSTNYTLCSDPDRYVSFDGVHFTDHFHRLMAYFVLGNAFTTPPLILLPGCKVPIPDVQEPNTPLPDGTIGGDYSP